VARRQTHEKPNDFLPLILDKIAFQGSPVVSRPAVILIYPYRLEQYVRVEFRWLILLIR
jgi:hypothetical protein